MDFLYKLWCHFHGIFKIFFKWKIIFLRYISINNSISKQFERMIGKPFKMTLYHYFRTAFRSKISIPLFMTKDIVLWDTLRHSFTYRFHSWRTPPFRTELFKKYCPICLHYIQTVHSVFIFHFQPILSARKFDSDPLLFRIFSLVRNVHPIYWIPISRSKPRSVHFGSKGRYCTHGELLICWTNLANQKTNWVSPLLSFSRQICVISLSCTCLPVDSIDLNRFSNAIALHKIFYKIVL